MQFLQFSFIAFRNETFFSGIILLVPKIICSSDWRRAGIFIARMSVFVD